LGDSNDGVAKVKRYTGDVAAGEGLRERKKRQTKQAIADAALKLFGERGFDEVTVAEIARAADVSEQTVYNHFPTKERLLFGDDEEMAAMMQALRAPGASPVQYFRSETLAFIDRLARDPVEQTLAIPRIVMGSAALRSALFEAWSLQAEHVAAALAERSGAERDDAVHWFSAHVLIWAHRTIFQMGVRRLVAGQDKRLVALRLRLEAEAIYKLLDRVLDVMVVKRRRRS
jgi:AcrR family transcriptional regulator